MKHTILLTTIILCLVIFVTTLIAGVVLTITTIGWKELLSTEQFNLRTDQLVDQMQNWGFNLNFGPLDTYSVDETKTDSLNGIETIVITGISEDITITEEGSQFSGRIKGSYRGSTQLTWTLTKTGQILRLKAEYPRWGFRIADLAIHVQIPQSFKGTVEIHSISGNTTIVNSNGSNWSAVDFTGVSGRLNADTAVWSKVTADSVSGKLFVSSLTGKASLKTISGDIRAAYKTNDPKELKADTVSGRVELSIPEAAKFTVNFDTVSGSFDSSKLPVQITSQIKRKIDASRNGGGDTLSVKTISGSLTLTPAS